MSFKKFSQLYFALLLAHIVILIREPESALVWVTKPTLLISLTGYYLQHGFRRLHYFEKLFVAGLVFSLAGDVLLLWDQLFIAGLSAFLLAQLSYTFSFYRSNRGTKGFVAKYPLIAVPVFLYGFGIVAVLWPGLGPLAAPVFVYATIISLMLLSAINRKGVAQGDSFQFIVLGAVLFVISDSILAFDKFHTEYTWARPMIMSTYGLAQYFLVYGMKKAVE